jgi:DNA modification methylase
MCSAKALNCLSERQWLHNQNPIWWFNKKELNMKYDLISRQKHPAIFPTALAKRIIENYTHSGETVLDVFSGMGTILYATRLTGRHGVGVELNQAFADITAARLNLKEDNYCSSTNMKHNLNRNGLHLHQICTDARNLQKHLPPDSIDLVFTSPPYWDLLKQRASRRNVKSKKFLKNNYSDSNQDLSNNSTLEEFGNNIKDIFKKAYSILKPGHRCILNTADYRRAGKYISLSSMYISIMKDLDFKLKNVIIWDRKQEYDIGIFSYPRNFIVNNGMFEYILEFQK